MIAVQCSTSLDCFTLPPPPVENATPRTWRGKRTLRWLDRKLPRQISCSLTIAPSGQIAADGDDFVTEKGGKHGGSANSGGLKSKYVHLYSTCINYVSLDRSCFALANSGQLLNAHRFLNLNVRNCNNCHIHLCSSVKSAMTFPSFSMSPISKAVAAAACYRRGKWPHRTGASIYDFRT